MSKLRDVLEQIEKHGELRDVCGTRYEKSRLLAPAIRRHLICVEPRRGRYELTPAGRQRLDGMRSAAPRRPMVVRCGILSCVMVIVGLSVGGLHLPFGRMPPGTAPASEPSPDKGWAMVRAVDDLKGSLPADPATDAVNPGQSTPTTTSDPESALPKSAMDGNPTGPAASGDDAGQRVTKGAKKRRRAHSSVDRRERVAETGGSRFNGPLFGDQNLRRGRSHDSWPGPSNRYRDERYPAAPLR
jgi:hypothetical protein